MTTRQTPDAVREALRAQHDWHYKKAKALSKQPQTADVQWRRNEHREQIDAIAFALSALDSRAGDAGEGERLARIRTSMALLQQNSEACAHNHYGDDTTLHGMPGWLIDTKADLDAFTDLLAKWEADRG